MHILLGGSQRVADVISCQNDQIRLFGIGQMHRLLQMLPADQWRGMQIAELRDFKSAESRRKTLERDGNALHFDPGTEGVRIALPHPKGRHANYSQRALQEKAAAQRTLEQRFFLIHGSY